jgi:predicted O-methyltransferase YrrM
MIVTRRPDLPGIDTLFGASKKPAASPPPPEPTADVSDTPVASDPPQAPALAPEPASPAGVPEPGQVDEAMRAGAITAVCEPSAALQRAHAAAAAVLTPPSDEVGALLRFVTACVGAKAVVEVGSAAGVSGLWLLDGAAAHLMLTSIESDEHVHKLAKAAYRDAGVTGQVRAIHADGQTVLPRLTDESYDVVLLQAGAGKLAGELADAVRLLRPGGVLIARGVLRGGAHAKANAGFVNSVAEHRFLTVSVLPVDDGVVLATKTV